MADLRTDVRDRATGSFPAAALLVLAAGAWWGTVALDRAMQAGPDMVDGMAGEGMAADGVAAGGMAAMTLPVFLGAWALMMAAMMLPAVTPVVRLYQRAAAAGRVAPTGVFVGGYLVLWAATGLPAWVLWRALARPLEDGEAWAATAAGVVLLAGGAWQFTPWKHACLRHCRSPMGWFLRLRGSLARPWVAAKAGAQHAAYCMGCCAAAMVVLVATAAMGLWWALAIAGGVFAERNLPHGHITARALGGLMLALGALVLGHPPLLVSLT